MDGRQRLGDRDGLDGRHVPVAVVGGGQAGLSMSYHLQRRGVEHVVIEGKTAGHDWTDRRWDSFCLVTPNWQCRLPGHPYAGDDPDGFMVRDEIAAYLAAYVARYQFPLFEGVTVTRLHRDRAGRFHLGSTAGDLTADQVVVATGPYQAPRTPRLAERLPEDVTQLHSAAYRSPAGLPEGAVLVVGTGQSGCQIAEDLHLAHRQVHLAVGGATRVARRYRGRDVVAWLEQTGYYQRAITEFPEADWPRLHRANQYVTGRDGGHDIDLRAFATEGMRLYGRLADATTSGLLSFGDDLGQNLDVADAASEGVKNSIDAYIEAAGLDAPAEDRYVPVWAPGPDHPVKLDLAADGVTAVVWATGFGADHRWIEVPVFDGRGYPTHRRGVTSCPGLYFLGLPWQHTWGSGRFGGVAQDAEYLAGKVTGYARPNEVSWIAGTPMSTFPEPEQDQDWTAPRTVA
jgi:putative flavoprotein involved in K+ transport